MPPIQTTDTAPGHPAGPAAGRARSLRGDDALDAVERSLTQLARALLRLGVPPEAPAENERIDRAGYWAMVRLGEAPGPVRLSDLAASLELDLSTVSRQARHLVDSGLVTRQADPGDGRAALLSLSERGCAVLEAVRCSRRELLRQTLTGWGAAERSALAAVVTRLAADMQGTVTR